MLCLLALATRLPLLELVPRFSDETNDLLLAYGLVNGEMLPLVNYSSYVGVLLTYLVAPLYKLFGPRLELARLVVALFGVATLLPTYLLARRLGGPLAGLAAALLLAASGSHSLVNSRVAWSHSITPFFSTLAIWLLARAVQERHGPSLAWAGLAVGLALQTHVTVAALLPGGLLFLIWKGRDLLATRWSALAVVAIVLVNANLVYYNLTSGGESIARAEQRFGEYASRDRPSYPRDLGELLAGSVRLVGGSISDHFFETPPLLHVGGALLVGLVVVSLIFCALRDKPLPLLVVSSGVLLFPTFLTYYEPIMMSGRYVMPLLPVGFAAAGVALAAPAQPRPRARRGAWMMAALALLLAGVAHNLLGIYSYLSRSVDEGLTNERYYQAEVILLALPAEEEILLDVGLNSQGTGGGGDAMKQLVYLLQTNHRPYRVVTRPGRPGGTAGQTRTIVLRASSVAEIGGGSALRALLPAPDGPSGSRWGVYRVSYPATD